MDYVFRLRATYPLARAETDSEWREFGASEIELLDRTRRQRAHPRGNSIFRQNDEPLGIYWLEIGHALLSRTDTRGNETVFGIVGPGETIGHRAFFAGEPHTATARTLTDCRAYLIPRQTMHQLIDANPALGWWFLRTIACDHGPRNALILRGKSLPAHVRLVHLLLVLKDRFARAHQDGHLTFDLPIRHLDIANMLEVSPETISRTIRHLKDKGIATFNGHRVVVPHLARLLAAARPNG